MFQELAKLAQRSFVFFREFEKHCRIRYRRFELFLTRYGSFELTALLQKSLRGFLIIPKVRRRGLSFDLM
jgi:hypothetical protein